MTDENKPAVKAHRKAREHLSRLQRVRQEIQALAALHAPDAAQGPAQPPTAPPTGGTK